MEMMIYSIDVDGGMLLGMNGSDLEECFMLRSYQAYFCSRRSYWIQYFESISNILSGYRLKSVPGHIYYYHDLGQFSDSSNYDHDDKLLIF